MSRNDYWGRDEFDTPDVEVFDDPLEWAAYWHVRGSHEDVLNLTLIDIADSLRQIVAPPQPRGEEVSTTDPTLTLLRELQCRLDDLAAQVAHLSQRIDNDQEDE